MRLSSVRKVLLPFLLSRFFNCFFRQACMAGAVATGFVQAVRLSLARQFFFHCSCQADLNGGKADEMATGACLLWLCG